MDLKNVNVKKIREFSRYSPILFSLGFTLLAVLVHEAFSELSYLLFPHNTWGAILGEVLCIIWPVTLVVIFGFGFIFRQRGIRATIGAALPVFLLYGISVVAQLVTMADNPAASWKSGLEIFRGILLLLGVGFREEILYRGVIANAIARKYAVGTKGLWITVLSAGAMFGAMHLANMFHNVSFAGALTQAISTMASGVLYCAIYLRGGSIWGVALLHSMADTPGFAKILFANTAENLSAVGMISGYRPDLTQIVYFVGELLMAAYLLRKSKRQNIFDRIQQLKSSERADF